MAEAMTDETPSQFQHRTLADKAAARIAIARLPIAEKLAIADKLRDAACQLRRIPPTDNAKRLD
jgi:hypothetical protein